MRCTEKFHIAKPCLPQHEATFDSVTNLRHKVGDVTLKVGNGERLFKDVRGVSATGQGTHCGQVTAVTTLRLNDEHTGLGSRG